jgi:hypothetical protein
MFGRLRAAKENLRRAFAAQFGDYYGQLVYRRMLSGAPIAVTGAERDAFIADFERFIPRFIWILLGSTLGLMLALVIIDVAGLLPIPDWVPLIAVFIPFGFLIAAYRRALTAPQRALAMRPPMGGERSKAETADAQLRVMAWTMLVPAFVIGGALLALVGYAALANPIAYERQPWVMAGVILLGGWLFLATLHVAFRKWRLSR